MERPSERERKNAGGWRSHGDGWRANGEWGRARRPRDGHGGAVGRRGDREGAGEAPRRDRGRAAGRVVGGGVRDGDGGRRRSLAAAAAAKKRKEKPLSGKELEILESAKVVMWAYNAPLRQISTRVPAIHRGGHRVGARAARRGADDAVAAVDARWDDERRRRGPAREEMPRASRPPTARTSPWTSATGWSSAGTAALVVERRGGGRGRAVEPDRDVRVVRATGTGDDGRRGEEEEDREQVFLEDATRRRSTNRNPPRGRGTPGRRGAS